MKNIQTCELVEELITREGIEEIVANPYELINIGDKIIEGLARILIITD